nr:hypothetical protein [Tanacetum cinerariifolium]
ALFEQRPNLARHCLVGVEPVLKIFPGGSVPAQRHMDGLPVLDVSDAQLVEDAGGVVVVALLHAGHILSRGHQVKGDSFGQSLRFDGEHDVGVGSNPLFELVANV